MMDLVGTQISAAERMLLQHPLVGGVILFTRNFTSLDQIMALIAEIHELRKPHLLIAIDHEGGRVQRFHEGFTKLPPASVFGEIYKQDHDKARQYAETTGWLMAAELRAIGVDFSFAPVLDLAHGVSGVIGNRAFHSKPEVAATLAYAFMHGMSQAGMSGVGKHFPGHGGVSEDSHLALPIDHRVMESLMKADIIPFEKMIHNHLPAIMPAHVIYDQIDDKPAGYSEIWLKKILRDRLKFQGVIFSDDLSMEAAGIGGSYGERAQLALKAGCDMVLVCNHPEGVAEVIEALGTYSNPASELRLARMHGKNPIKRDELLASEKWQQASQIVQSLDDSPELELDV